MKRYNYYGDPMADCYCEMEEADEGDYICYGDHLKELAKLKAERDAIIATFQRVEAREKENPYSYSRLTKNVGRK